MLAVSYPGPVQLGLGSVTGADQYLFCDRRAHFPVHNPDWRRTAVDKPTRWRQIWEDDPGLIVMLGIVAIALVIWGAYKAGQNSQSSSTDRTSTSASDGLASLTEDDTASLEAEIRTLEAEIEELESTNDQLGSGRDEVDAELEDLRDDIKRCQWRYDPYSDPDGLDLCLTRAVKSGGGLLGGS